jgi:alpha-beta hydrolase superfamily lysophospholipase
LRAAGFTVLGLDLQGHGCSEGRRGDFTIEELVTNTRDVLTYALREIGPAVGLLGSSQGAIIVLYTLAADERAMSAVCHNAALLDEPGSRRVNVSRFSRLMRPLVGPASRLLPGLRLPIRRYLRIETVWEDLALGRKLEADPLVVKSYTLRSFASLASARPARPIEWVSTPTLFLAAEHDRLFPTSYVRSIFDRLRCRKAMVVVPDTTHMLFVEYLEQSLPPVVEWFERTLRSGGSS